jgi:putative hydroxymethylpyrimidine transport system ATP-binding protein
LNLIRLAPTEEEVTVPHIQINNVSLAYNDDIVFSHLSMDLPPGRWVGLLGQSGVGKSSFLRMIAGLTQREETSQGFITADNAIPVHQQVSYMAQTDLLMPWLTVLSNATLGFKLRKKTRKEYDAGLKQATELLEKVGLGDAMHLYPHQLSGGMRQRVALVRTLMEMKPIVLMDEPFSALDAITRYKLQDLTASLMKDKTVLFITHDPAEAIRLAHDIYIMQAHPKPLKPVATLTSPTPRELTDPEIATLQSLLFDELTKAAGESL